MVLALLAACAPTPETIEVEKIITQVVEVKETVEVAVEKVVEKEVAVKETVQVVVEKLVTPTAPPAIAAVEAITIALIVDVSAAAIVTSPALTRVLSVT